MTCTSLIGQSFNYWTVLSSHGYRGHHEYLLCECKCGTIRPVRKTSLVSGGTISCRCLFKETRSIHPTHVSHGMTHSREYSTWENMIQRCSNPNSTKYRNYGGRGIRVCEAWSSSFETFLYDMGERPQGRSIDRINVNGNYEPGNCRWATNAEQANNKRKKRSE